MTWETVIGLEVHMQLATKTKIFSGSSTAFGAEPNTQANAIDLAMPGTLPVLNEAALRHAITFGVAIGAKINQHSVFERKNYFYPDLPKGYQTTQLAEPIVGPGSIEIELADGTSKPIRIHHAHLEEDAGKSLHEDFHGLSGIDLNRAGTPLIEIVSEPDMSSAEEAVAFAKKLHSIVTSIGVTDGDMSQGSMRFDVNVSVRKKGTEKLGTRTETKNLNSFRFIEEAIRLEVARQIDVLEDGGSIVQETRLYDGEKKTRSVTSIGVNDGDMSQGSMRFDVNVSVRKKGTEKLGTRTETKNLNSFRFIEEAIRLEVARQIDVLEDGGSIVQETRLYDGEKKT